VRRAAIFAVTVTVTVTVTAASVRGAEMSDQVATGSFDVAMTPAAAPAPEIGSWTLAKSFHGDLSATSTGQMLSAGDPAHGTAGYVAIELVSGMLGGRRGSFALQHSGTMANGAQTLAVTVVPGSATGDVVGLAGTMTIDTAGGGHRYVLHYHLPQ